MRDYDKWAQSLQNFAWLQDCVPGAMDCDFLIERRGRFFIAEFKTYNNGVRLPFGQHLALAALAKVPAFDVYLVGQSERYPDRYYVAKYGVRDPVITGTRRPVWFPPARFERASQESLRLRVQEWFQSAGEAA